ncbi:hypothetical protein POG14_00875 [Clostridium paraputrificum]|uniref:hypothetical protein n=1 Tax=Clostridium paraputrificum TaxID=29363 RepID=UPI00189AE920|nr:hypothetical protein [Clostridium paraputrificum]MDC0800720.1 hypothetical protein [Clostridium paraputrificum]
MKKNYYEYATWSLIVSGLIALSYYKNGDAINLFSIVAAVVSVILGVYSLFSSISQNQDTSKLVNEIDKLNDKINFKLDNINDKLTLSINGKEIDNTNIREGVSIFVQHTNSKDELKVNKKDFKEKMNETIMNYGLSSELIDAQILSDDMNVNSVSLVVIMKGKIGTDQLVKIIDEVSRDSRIVTNANGGTCITHNTSMIINI